MWNPPLILTLIKIKVFTSLWLTRFLRQSFLGRMLQPERLACLYCGEEALLKIKLAVAHPIHYGRRHRLDAAEHLSSRPHGRRNAQLLACPAANSLGCRAVAAARLNAIEGRLALIEKHTGLVKA